MMSQITFDDLISQLQGSFSERDYSAAIKLATDGLIQFPERRTILDFWCVALWARSGEVEKALSSFQDALEHGSWFSDVLLRQSPSLQLLQGDPRFESLVANNQGIAERAQGKQYPYYILRPQGKCQTGAAPCPLLIGLHASGGSVETSMDFWKPVAALGWLVAAPQSSQAIMKGIFVWDDRSIAEKELAHDIHSLVENYSINPWRTVLAGHSSSAETAIWLTLSGELEVKRFLAIGPLGPLIDDLSNWDPLLDEGLPGGIRGYVILGELDGTIRQDNILSLVEKLNQAGVATEIEIVSIADQNYQPGYDSPIERGLNFLTG